MLAIYIDKNVPRLQYTVNLVFKTVLKVDYILIHDKQVFIESKLPKISYSTLKIADEIHFFSTNLLFETTIQKQTIAVTKVDDLPTFFYHNKNAILPYDPFAMIFYLVSRYEEYTETQRDKFQRFRAVLSLAYQEGFLKQPVVNQLCLNIQAIIEAKYPSFEFPKQSFQFLPTYDIDLAWAYLHRNAKRTIGGYARTILTANFKELWERLQVQFGLRTDPFFTYDILDELHKKHHLSPIYFFLIGDYNILDKNIHYKNEAFRQLIKRIAAKYTIGLHPSFLSNHPDKTEQLLKEKNRLEEITNQKIVRSRQHFLILETPRTYKRLLENGIKEDYTMGYAAQVGFRASIATPYFWYDLESEQSTDLQITPFQVMDVTLSQYLKLSPEESLVIIKELLQNTQAVNGTLCTLWHNNSIDQFTAKIYETIQKINP